MRLGLATVVLPCLLLTRPVSAQPKVGVFPGRAWSAEITVQNELGRSQGLALVQGGFPLARGMVRAAANLELTEASGGRVLLQSRTLSYWPDGSSRWVELSFYSTNLRAHETRAFRLSAGGAEQAGLSLAPPAQDCPDGIEIELVDRDGQTTFLPGEFSTRYVGPVATEGDCRGQLQGRKERTSLSLELSRFPKLKAVRYRLGIEQHANGGLWRRLTLRLPHARVMVHRERELGAVLRPEGERRWSVTLIADGHHPVDAGVGRRWEIWGYDDPDRFQSRAIVPRFRADYLLRSGALGAFPLPRPQDWQQSFERSWNKVLARRNADPANFGWRHFGDFSDREHGLEYLGYLNQEYDPATALFLAYARSEDVDYLEHALDLARFFRDMCVSPEGGVFSHRATLHTAQARLIEFMSRSLLNKMRADPAYRPSPDGLGAVALRLYGPSARSVIDKILRKVERLTPDQMERRFTTLVASRLLEATTETLRDRIEAAAAQRPPAISMRRLVELYRESEEIEALGLPDGDQMFQSFFERYGGSWAVFPGFHVDLHPDPTVRHSGSHSLVEMLVLAYWLTGEESLRESALLVARHHLEEIVPREIEDNEKLLRTESPLFTRSLAWPLINLLALWDLTEYRQPELNSRIRQAALRLARQLARNPAERCEGSVSSGVTMEALARYHEKTRDSASERTLVSWATYWAGSQWNPRRRAFQYRHGVRDPSARSLTALNLYGLAYASRLHPVPWLRQRVLEARDSLLGYETDYAKDFAMSYRSTPRALAIIEGWDHEKRQPPDDPPPGSD